MYTPCLCELRLVEYCTNIFIKLSQKQNILGIQIAKERGANLRLGTELEIPGYSCCDHFLETDTFLHSLEVLAEIIKHPIAQDILIVVGM